MGRDIESIVKTLKGKKVVTRNDILKEICSNYQLDFKAFREFVSIFESVIKELALNGVEVKWQGLFSLTHKESKEKRFIDLNGNFRVKPTGKNIKISVAPSLKEQYKQRGERK